MDDNHRKSINDNLERLSENSNFSNLLAYLKAKGIFTSKQLQKYESVDFNGQAEELKCQQIFKDIQTRGPQAFQILLDCLKYTGHRNQFKLLSRPSHFDNSDITELRVKKSTSFPPSSIPVYKMTSYPKGYYIFINNQKFKLGTKRGGADQDRNFIEVLEDMGFKGEVHTNKTTQEMRDLLKNFSKKRELTIVDSCIVVISSHGSVTESKELVVDGIDDDNKSHPLLCNELISYFNVDECMLRQGQPKIFIIQACRGNGYIQQGMVYDRSEVEEYHPTWNNTFLLAPCMEGFLAHRDSTYGSWLFRALTDVFLAHAHNKDLVAMKDMVNEIFDSYHEAMKDQTCNLYEYGVSKKLYFNPGLYEQRDI